MFGLDTPTTGTTSSPKNTAGLSFAFGEELYAAAQAQIDELKDGGCSVIVCIGHLGEESANQGNNAVDVVENTRGLSVLIDGHDHQVENQTVKDLEGSEVLIAEAGGNLRGIGVLTYEDGAFTESLVKAGTYTGSDPEVAEMVAGIATEIKASLGEIVAVSDWDLDGSAINRETNLSDLAVDSIYWQVSQATASAPDAVVMNSAAIRRSISAGEIRRLDINDVFPFGNQLCTIEVTGAQLLEALEAATQACPEHTTAFPQVSHIKYTLDETVPYERGDTYPGTIYYAPAAPGARVTITEIGGRAFDPEATYTIATIDFVASGGDPAPMWYRQATSNDWTLATADGWQAVRADISGGIYTRVWEHSGTNAELTAWNMWYFGENPPAVEITETGGVSIVSAAFTGKFARFEWKIDDEVEIRAGSRVMLQGRDSENDWQTVSLDESPTHTHTSTTVYGFFLDRKTFWRVRLEVPQ